MRLLLLGFLPFALLAGCRGHLADYIGPETSILEPQLTRYGLTSAQGQCVNQKLVVSLNELQLRRLATTAASVTDPARLTVPDFVHVSTFVKDPEVPGEVTKAINDCRSAANMPANAASAGAAPDVSAARTGTWLNLGAGMNGQVINIDASSITGEAPFRSAWFRVIDPDTGPRASSDLIQIDCSAKTINIMATRTLDGNGAVLGVQERGPAGAGATAIEGGSVYEIAYLSLCT